MSLLTARRNVESDHTPAARKLSRTIQPTNTERTFRRDEIIVSKTDLKGHLTYVNRTFMAISGYEEPELLGQPHSLIRHPEMPRCIFKLLWDRLRSGQEIFAYVKNMTKTGDYYWVLAHVTPSFVASGEIVGYHSNRRVADPRVLNDVITPLYCGLKDIEDREADRKIGLAKAGDRLNEILKEKGIGYDEFISHA
jgi:PAS domain S-box-containing protein